MGSQQTGRPKSAPRKRKRVASSPQRSAFSDGASKTMLAGLARDTLRGMKDDLRDADPLRAEMCASQLVTMLTEVGSGLIGTDVSEFQRAILVALGNVTGARTMADAVALLYAVASTAPPEHERTCRASIQKLMSKGAPAPTWTDTIGKPRVTAVWKGSDVWGDQDSYFVGFEYDGHDPHSLVVLVDHNLGGIVKDAFVADDVDDVVSAWQSQSRNQGGAFMTIERVETGQAGVELVLALERETDATRSMTSEDLDAMILLMTSRVLRMVEHADAGASLVELEPPAIGEHERDQLVREFLDAEGASCVALAERDGGDLSYVASCVIDYVCDYVTDPPFRFSPGLAEICLLDWFPRRINVDDASRALIVPVMREWARFAGRKRGLPAAAIAETVAIIDDSAQGVDDAFDEPQNHGFAKRIFSSMIADGVDPEDSDAVQQWIDDFNAGPQSRRNELVGRP